MRAALLVKPRSFELRMVPLPSPGSGEVRVRLEGCGVCASNIPSWEGRPWFSYPMAPGALGHEGWGRIDALGESVDGWRAGQRVAFLSGTAYAEHDLVRTDALLALPDDVGAFPAEPLGCALNVFRRSQIGVGDFVAIIGIGFLGALLIQLARNAGARVIAFARRPFALEVARSLGAETIQMDERNAAARAFSELTGGLLADVTIESTGAQEPLHLAGELTRERGRLVIAGYHQDGIREVNLQLWNWRGLDVINAHERDPAIYLEGMRLALEEVQAERLDPAPLFTHRFPLEELGRALEMTRDRPDGFMKALITL